ncbi:MAG: hypothetical protein PHU14_00080 [Methylovulum sp.]|nr:hypothetical protein [Methylovulum sp.]
MAETNETDAAAIGLSLNDAAALLNVEDGKLLSFKDYGGYLVGVTVDGQKIQADKTDKTDKAGKNGKK